MYVRNRVPRICLKKDALGNSGIHIFDEDLVLMKQLLIHQSMRSTSIHELLRLLAGGIRSESAISKRLGKLVAAGILVQMREVRAQNFFTFHHRLGKRGIDVLVTLNVLSEKEAEILYENIRKVSFPFEHTDATSVIANRIFMNCIGNEALSDITQSKGSAHEDFGTPFALDPNERDTIIPDWVFSNGNTLVCIEVDTGTQKRHTITKKYDWYIKRAKALNAKGKKLVVIFSVVNRTVSLRYSEKRKKRIASLKEIAPPIESWSDNQSSEELGLHFYVVSASRTPPLVENILTSAEPLSAFERFQYADDWRKKALYVLKEDYDLEELDMDSLLGTRRNQQYDCDLMVAFRPKSESEKGTERIYSIIYGEEGSVVTNQLIRANSIRMTTLNGTGQYPECSLLVVYDDKVNVIEDVYGQSLTCKLIETDVVSWVHAMKEDTAAPDMMRVLSQFKKNWRAFDE